MSQDAPVICEKLWKIFGRRAGEALEAARNGTIEKDEAFDRFGCVIGVADASFTVAKGETFCIMGLSGSGKSTILRHVNRLIEPTDGRIRIEGQDIMELSKIELRRLRARRIGMVFQHMALWPHKTIRQNVAFGLEVQRSPKDHRNSLAEEALERVGLAGWSGRYPDELSGGMQQRVGLARALAADPEILLMDEPFSALDPLIRKELQDEFLRIARRVNKTTIFITHDLHEAMKMGDRIAIMKDGRIEQTGTPETIVLQPATDYVTRFVSSVSTLKYISAEQIMVEGPAAAGSPVFGPSTPLPALLEAFSEGAEDAAIMDGNRFLGRVGRADVLRAVQSDLARV